MRFLCLHGRGTNSDIFESQLAPLLSRISPQHTFDFVDAKFECPAASGIAGLYPPPYLAWHERYEPEHIQDVHNFLRTVIDEDGPYDGVVGFSQGAALAASFLLAHEHDGAAEAPFKVAVFLYSVMLFSPSENIGTNIGREIVVQEEKHTAFLRGLDPSQLAGAEMTETAQNSCSHLNDSTTAPPPNVFGFLPETFATRISIPTLHVVGKRDPFAEHSRALVTLCQEDRSEVLLVDGGHELPRIDAALDRLAEQFELVALMGSLGGA